LARLITFMYSLSISLGTPYVVPLVLVAADECQVHPTRWKSSGVRVVSKRSGG
jgi:hypothetical protein